MTILLTGAGGFLGLNIVEALLEQGLDCVALNDRALPTDFCDRSGLICEVADVRDRSAMAEVLRRHGIRSVIHAAAVTLAPGSALTTVERAFDVNMVSTAILLEEVRKAGIARFVYPSSTAVYGAALFEDAPVTEATPPRPASVYGYTKLASERLVAETAGHFGLSCVRARITALFGPHERETGTRDLMSLPFQMARAAQSDKEVILPEGLRRDWTSSRDVAAALVLLAIAPKLPSDLYNLGLGASWYPVLLARQLSENHPRWHHGIGRADGSDCRLILHDDPTRTRQPLVATKFEQDFDFRFRSPEAACRDYAQWLKTPTAPPTQDIPDHAT
ncbi:hypothetical protein P775_23400 [Puniceibacterium antarcticum]|uniref:NAD-dependent epimerase/dehydratase domain-containing protein n=1 Tax=Puniceibacterium antarcticum TaxID=1206336 RepID=A0A2G8R850_9RHOB|nr:NAD(P)-dependent oxidoreductase [Puniceibacterium antarcticum]PIL17724.1 hypothetical protein P775_23400 [Puniceibacterium antarcticum]